MRGRSWTGGSGQTRDISSNFGLLTLSDWKSELIEFFQQRDSLDSVSWHVVYRTDLLRPVEVLAHAASCTVKVSL